MVLPLGDDNSDRKAFPIVNISLIVINILVFVFLQGLGQNDRFTYSYSTVPEEITTGRDITTPDHTVVDPSSAQRFDVPGLGETKGSVYLTLITSMFMHGSIMHILGNMLFLWIFGDNLEDALGKIRYLAFYLICGVIASLAHVVTNWDSLIPSLGASGAISGVLGGYILLHPHRRVRVLLFQVLTQVPAWVAIGMWFVFQIIESLLNNAGGVAYAAHIGGFIAGLILIKPFMIGRPASAP
jgi:membrane associated rhomboid family serine protease